ncbi:MAG: response regulator [Flavisolibacter sp.]
MKKEKCIVYVDDDIDDINLMKEVFPSQSGYILRTCEGGEALFQCLHGLKREKSLPCLIVLDVNMPVQNGWEILKDLKNNSEYSDIPVIMFTTSHHPIFKDKNESSYAEFVSKPTTFAGLKEFCSRIIGHCSGSDGFSEFL